ncbi:sugar phosphate isomerase/epimerase family protein [Sulfobacillus harzensis]|uniref:Sugar phosphate isomerase/epimerase n=1 Tax=Sulfobacillus harzensis TaxID=2729629 RepID=A0A7Y0Q2P9_9FIRM|nr:sugar phosphate isomerase/epimerase family protein [Sulfobacillus harzensis]NMP22757.1 sugar phosphate isomerase/epimerase [Sulfobacillus harzensis]
MDPRRFAVSAITTQRWSAWDDLRHYKALGVSGIGIWRQKLAGVDLPSYRKALANEGLQVTNLCFSGQFTLGLDKAIDDGKRALDEAAELGAPTVLIISGPLQSTDMESAEGQLKEGLQRLASGASELGITLALEALHPMDMTQWTIISTVDKALDILDELDHPSIRLMLDLYNCWWDPSLALAIRRAGARIASVQLADWRNPTRSFTDRTVPGRGVAPLARLIATVEEAGYSGFYDLEIFSDEIWGNPEKYETIVSEAVQWWTEAAPHA